MIYGGKTHDAKWKDNERLDDGEESSEDGEGDEDEEEREEETQEIA